MSSFWDSLGHKLLDGTLSYTEFEELVTFLKEFDSKNENITSEYLRKHYSCNYVFSSYDTLLSDIQNKGISKSGLEWVISNLHTLDHDLHQSMMYTYEVSKHYWRDHSQYRNSFGLMKKGRFEPLTRGVGFKRF